MRTAALCCNLVLFVSICLTLFTEGIPTQTIYVLFTLLSLVVPLLTLAVILRGGARGVAIAANVLLFACVAWAGIAQYPYAEGNGIIPFVALMVVTPILSLAVLLKRAKSARQVGAPAANAPV